MLDNEDRSLDMFFSFKIASYFRIAVARSQEMHVYDVRRDLESYVKLKSLFYILSSYFIQHLVIVYTNGNAKHEVRNE